MPITPQRSRVIVWVVVAGLLTTWAWLELGTPQRPDAMSYSDFRTQVVQDNVRSVTAQGQHLTGTLKKAIKQSGQSTLEFTTYLPSFGGEKLMSLLEAHNVQVRAQPVSESLFWPIMIGVAPIVLLIGLGVLMFRGMRNQGRGVMSVGRSQAKLYERRAEHTTFDDVAGAAGAKTELAEIVDVLRHPSRYERLGAKVPRGVLLVGPPGTGKTLLARAVAGEAEVPFFSITGSDFMEMFVGVGASRVRAMFTEAKKVAPSIVFIDELDSVGRRRGAGLGGGHDEREQTLNQLLSELDGFEPNESVIVIAATNRPDILDPALLRPGRIDRQVVVDLPTVKEREAILAIHARGRPLSSEVDLSEVARGTPGYSGADLENLLNEAVLLATRAKKDHVDPADVEEARDKVVMGLTREGLTLSPDECRLVASHEAGHAVVAAMLPGMDPVHKVSIVPRGRAMGVTQQMPLIEHYVHTMEELEQRLAVLMGGRAAELLLRGTLTSGAEDDLKRATQLARKMVLDWAMGAGHLMSVGHDEENVFLGEEITRQRPYSETTAREVDQEVEAVLAKAFDRATSILRANRAGVDRLVEALITHEEVIGKDVLALINQRPKGDGDSNDIPPPELHRLTGAVAHS